MIVFNNSIIYEKMPDPIPEYNFMEDWLENCEWLNPEL